jgi:hypothetical protein
LFASRISPLSSYFETVLLQQILFSILLSSRCLSPASSNVSLSRAQERWAPFSVRDPSRCFDFPSLLPVVRLISALRVSTLALVFIPTWLCPWCRPCIFFLLAKAPVELFVRAARWIFFVLRQSADLCVNFSAQRARLPCARIDKKRSFA